MDRLQTCLWFEKEAQAAAEFYTSLFPDAKMVGSVPYGEASAQASKQPVGSTMTVEFSLAGTCFLALNGGPHFKINPAISFFVTCNSEMEIGNLWKGLNQQARMPLQKYPFAEKYGWCEDRFGVNWQLFYQPAQPANLQKICPALLFANKMFGQAANAIEFYVGNIPNSNVKSIARDEKTGAVLHARLSLSGQDFVMMEGPLEQQFEFSPGVSFVAGCASQAEIDSTWSKLSAVPEAEQCGWLCDRFGVSWQVVPQGFGKMIQEADSKGRERMMSALMKMKKIDMQSLTRALTD